MMHRSNAAEEPRRENGGRLAPGVLLVDLILWDLSEGAVFRWPVEQVPCFFYTRQASASSS
jgi:hypothetical protein